MALVRLIEQHRADALQLGILDDLRHEDRLGHHQHAGLAGSLGVEPGKIADRLARFLAQQFGHPLGGGTGGDAARAKAGSTVPLHHSSPSRAGATAVVLPAPGGAIRTAELRSRKAASRSGEDSVDGERQRHAAIISRGSDIVQPPQRARDAKISVILRDLAARFPHIAG